MIGLSIALLAGLTAPAEPAVIRDCAQDCPVMVVIPAGEFLMGSDAEERRREGIDPRFGDREMPQHMVRIAKAFAMSRDEITRGEYAAFVAATRRPDPPSCGTFVPGGDGKDITRNWQQVKGASWRNPGYPQASDHPVACINYADATDYAAWLSSRTGHHYRLPSEAEWEYAARAGTRTARYWGDDSKPICSLANVMTSATETAIGWPAYEQGKLVCASDNAWTTAVGTFPPNPFGLRDMIGNVWEWVSDCRHLSYAGAPADGSAWQDIPGCRHFQRGGAYHSEVHLSRAATRLWVDGAFGGTDEARSGMNGMRLVREMDD